MKFIQKQSAQWMIVQMNKMEVLLQSKEQNKPRQIVNHNLPETYINPSQLRQQAVEAIMPTSKSIL